MIGHQRSISERCSAASASGFNCSGAGITAPRSVSRLLTAASVNAATTAVLSFSITGAGVPFGAHSPNQYEAWKSGSPPSCRVGMSDAEGRR